MRRKPTHTRPPIAIAALERIATRMRAMNLDPDSLADRAAYTKNVVDRIRPITVNTTKQGN